MLVQARLVNAVADGTELCGTWRTLALSLGVEPADLAIAAEELDAVGWVTTATGADGTVTMRWSDYERLPDDAAGLLCDSLRLGRWLNAEVGRWEDAA